MQRLWFGSQEVEDIWN